MAAKTGKKSSTTKPASAKSTTAKRQAKPKAKAKPTAKSKADGESKAATQSKTDGKSKAGATRRANVAAAKAVPSTRAKSNAKARLVDSPFKNFIPYEPKRGEAYMDSKQLDHFRDILLKWRLELMEEVDRTVHHMQDEAANFPDPADRATQEEEFSIELRTRDRERKLIKKIDQTVERIEQEDYGYCDTCGVEIGLRRLEARPTATQCVDCKTLDEIKERQLHG